MNRSGKLNIGDEVKNIVQDALNNGDFQRLNSDIKNVVKGALDEAKRSIDWKRENYSDFNNPRKDSNNTMTNDENSSRGHGQNNIVSKSNKLFLPIGQMSGMLCTIFGIIGSTAFGIAIMVLTLLGYSLGSRGIFHTIAIGLFPFFIGCIILTMNGIKIRKRLKRFKKYISKMGGRNYGLITEFSSATGLNDKSTVKDLRKMIDIGMFPEGHIDDKKTYFILNNECYEQYIKLQEDMGKKELEEKEKQKSRTRNQDHMQREKNRKNNELKPEIRKAIDEGRQFVIEIKQANIAIPGEEISRKLDRLEEVTGKIFDYVEIHPEKFPEIKKFAEYFLPTTLKLLDAYGKFDCQPVQGENISNSKKEIEATMDTINIAFENLFDGLFEEVAMDISTDISVLETMFAQEGLTVNSMRIKNKTMEDKNEQ